MEKLRPMNFKRVGCGARVVRHEPITMMKGTALEREDPDAVLVVAHGFSGIGDNPEYMEVRARLRKVDAEKSFPVGRVVVVAISQALFEPTLMPCEEMTAEEAASLC